MKKWFIVFLVAAAAPLFATNEVNISGKIGFFYPSDTRMQNVYGGGFIYGPEISWRCMEIVDLFVDAMYFDKSGSSRFDQRHTRIRILPISLGARIVFPLPHLEIYLGASAKHFNVNIHNSSPYTPRKSTKNGVGWGVKGGFSVLLPKNFCFDIFLEYISKKFDFHSSHPILRDGKVDVGGGIVGASLGYRF